MLAPGARNICVKHKAEGRRNLMFGDEPESEEENPSCTYKIMDGVLKYLKAFKPSFQENIVNYTLCTINKAPVMTQIGSGDNCYLAFAYPETQFACLKELGPSYLKSTAFQDSINLE